MTTNTRLITDLRRIADLIEANPGMTSLYVTVSDTAASIQVSHVPGEPLADRAATVRRLAAEVGLSLSLQRHDDGTATWTTPYVSGVIKVYAPLTTDDLAELDRDEYEPPEQSEQWQPGDVVRNADDDADTRTWVHDPSSEDDSHPWAQMAFGGSVSWLTRQDLPTHLTLLVRDGRVVVR